MNRKSNETDKLIIIKETNKMVIFILILIVIIILLYIIAFYNKNEYMMKKSEIKIERMSQISNIQIEKNESIETDIKKDEVDLSKQQNQVIEWNLTLVNQDNTIPKNYEVSLANIDEYRMFDSRAINDLKDMLNEMKKSGITDMWIQSSYRSTANQEDIYNKKKKEYISLGKTEEEARLLTEKTINESGHSEHNLGLAIDFNYINNEFEKSEAFKWLSKNAENYGFILRYSKDKEHITKVKYEPWHWRYVGKEHAKKMNNLNMCLEEYIEYLKF